MLRENRLEMRLDAGAPVDCAAVEPDQAASLREAFGHGGCVPPIPVVKQRKVHASRVRSPVVGFAHAAFFQAAAKTPAPISNAPPVRLTARCTDGLRIARRAPDA